jgi:uncharacterized protein YfdQ (DUF2303 family)
VSDNDNNPTASLTINSGAASQEHITLDASTIKRIGELTLAAADTKTIGRTAHLVIPEGCKHVDLTPLLEKASPEPQRKRGTVQFSELASFNLYVVDQGDPVHTYIYADADSRTLTAVLNDQVKGRAAAGWRDFRAVYTAELSREFATWQAHDRKVMEQEEFAIFLEDNIADIVDPAGETMLQVASSLQAKTEVQFASHKRLDNGQVQFLYNETTEARAAGGSLEVPREFALGVRLFKNGDGYRVRARLKYRLHSGKLKFWYELERPENAIEDAFKAYIDQAREHGFTVLLGKA